MINELQTEEYCEEMRMLLSEVGLSDFYLGEGTTILWWNHQLSADEEKVVEKAHQMTTWYKISGTVSFWE